MMVQRYVGLRVEEAWELKSYRHSCGSAVIPLVTKRANLAWGINDMRLDLFLIV
jgi:hypothetical protein